ncbi:MAG: hydantoinase B/oxoprolinase family protein [Alphaproteobacteria bacterium]|nr:hydantoinase B/oxoprolinase family protein [Alphaproteobacteria bacterium]
MNSVDPVTYSVIWGGLISAAAEMGVTLSRTAYSVAVREGSDFSTGVFDPAGNMIAQGDYSPGHLGSMAFAVRRMLQDYPIERLNPGDAVICNDPGIGSGHLPDVYMMCPVYLDGALLGFAVNIAHQIDIGGSGAGSQTITGIQDNYQEGLRFLPTRCFVKGEPVRDIFRVIEANVRVPEVLGDLRAQYTANMTGARRMEDLARLYGPAVLRQAMADIIEQSGRQMRAAIDELKPGIYTFADCMDDVGPGTGPVEAKVKVTIGNGCVHVDWAGSGPQREAGMNSYLHYTTAYSIAAVKSVTLPTVPQNDGIIRTIEVEAPLGSFFNPARPAPCGGRAVVSHRIYEVVMGALAKAAPERVIAATAHFYNPNIGGVDPRTGRQFICWESIIGGVGARWAKDGVEATSSPWNGTNVPVEIQESRNPVIIEQLGLIADSAGPGRFRGGCGLRKDLRVLAPGATLTNLGDRQVHAPYGLAGGKPGRLGITLLNPGGRGQRRLHSKGTYRLARGDVITWRTSGAGGVGDPFRRDPQTVLHDVLDGYVSIKAAAADYGVAVDAKTMTVDLRRTQMLRAGNGAAKAGAGPKKLKTGGGRSRKVRATA